MRGRHESGDGRNRLEACHRAGVEPHFWTFDGDDPVAFILSVNVHRRHLSKGQRAMAVAKAYSDYTLREQAKRADASRGLISHAAVVLEWAPDLADQVLAGGSLDQAYEVAQERKRLSAAVKLAIEEIGPAACDLGVQAWSTDLTLCRCADEMENVRLPVWR